ncbi:MAG: plasmid stabilization protein [Gammaproteobacteria bacterium HGW-Gammaproteobacteria-8]|nr:MAG: plasmid stabilization protein [Gammaproteobacteria bacterium HGW-Gammaproteobacteria-8]
MKLMFSATAVADLERLRRFIEEHDPDAASRVAGRLIEQIDHLRRFPELGRSVEQAPVPESLRDVIFGNYVIRYSIHAGTIVVLKVWHQAEPRGAGL